MDDAQKAAPFALIVDDNPVILLHVADMLEDAGFSTLAAADADTALDCLGERSGKIAFMFTNVQIPGCIDGFGLARYVAERWPNVGIVVSSGHVMPGEGSMPDGSIFIAKPFLPSEILQAVMETITSKGMQMPETLSA